MCNIIFNKLSSCILTIGIFVICCNAIQSSPSDVRFTESNSLTVSIKNKTERNHVNRTNICHFNVLLQRYEGIFCNKSHHNPNIRVRYRRETKSIPYSERVHNLTVLQTTETTEKSVIDDLKRKVRSLESRLLQEAVANRELMNSILRQGQQINTLDTSLKTYTNNFSHIEGAVKNLRMTMTKQQDVYRNMEHKLSGVMLDVAEVNNMLSTQRHRDSSDAPDKDIPVETASAITMCNIPANHTKYRDCKDVLDGGHTQSGVYYVHPLYAACPLPVWCDMDTPPGGWLITQKRYNGHVSFNRNWTSYRAGFGDVTDEHWLGNDNLFLLTNQRHYELRVDLWDFYGSRVFAEYKKFKIGGERDKYRLHLSNHTGTAPDGLGNHDDMYFSTPDEDNDAYPEYQCAKEWGAGWWFSNCWFVILNGQYYNHTSVEYRGISWNEWKAEQLNRVEMKIRPSEDV